MGTKIEENEEMNNSGRGETKMGVGKEIHKKKGKIGGKC